MFQIILGVLQSVSACVHWLIFTCSLHVTQKCKEEDDFDSDMEEFLRKQIKKERNSQRNIATCDK